MLLLNTQSFEVRNRSQGPFCIDGGALTLWRGGFRVKCILGVAVVLEVLPRCGREPLP